MRNVSGYLTDDGKFFQDKKEAEMHERFLNMSKHMDEFVRMHYDKGAPIINVLLTWEKYKSEVLR